MTRTGEQVIEEGGVHPPSLWDKPLHFVLGVRFSAQYGQKKADVTLGGCRERHPAWVWLR